MFPEMITPRWSKMQFFPGGSSLLAHPYSSLADVQKKS
jgi:hypothetical protein